MNSQPLPTPWYRGTKLRVVKGLLTSFAFGSLISFSGCSMSTYCKEVLSPYEEMGCCLVTDMRARTKAATMWRTKYAHCYGTVVTARDIRRGFVDGFAETANGGSGNAPLVPPEQYCGIGRKVEAQSWFKGYTLGAAAAESCGASQWRRSTVSPVLAACFATPQCSEGCVPCPQMCGCNNDGCNGNCGIAAPSPEMPMAPMATEYQGYSGMDTVQDEVVPEAPMSIQEPLRPEVDTLNTQELPGSEAANSLKDPLDLEAKGEKDSSGISSPSDAPLPEPLNKRDGNAPPKPAEAIERAIDDATSAIPARASQTAMTPYKLPSHRVAANLGMLEEPLLTKSLGDKLLGQPSTVPNSEPAVRGVIEAPVFAPSNLVQPNQPAVEASQTNDGVVKVPTSTIPQVSTGSTRSTGDASSSNQVEGGPVMSGPVEMPNIQVSFDWQQPQWLFGEVDVARALLEQSLPSVMDDQQ